MVEEGQAVRTSGVVRVGGDWWSMAQGTEEFLHLHTGLRRKRWLQAPVAIEERQRKKRGYIEATEERVC